MKKNRFILLLTVLLCPGMLTAQQSWDLKSCISYGVKYHRSTRVYENNRRIADAQAREALSAYLPKVDATGGFTDNLKPQVSIIPAGIFGPEDLKVAFTKQYNANGVIELNQPVYDQAALTGLKADKYNQQQAAVSQQQNQETIIYNISNAYYQVYVYQVQLSLLQATEKTYSEQLRISQLGVQKGVTAQVDLDKVQVNYNNTLSNIHVAESNLELSKLQLKNAMGYPVNEPLVLDSVPLPYDKAPAAQAMAQTATDSFSVSNRTDYRLSQINASLLDINARQIRAGSLPSLSFYARYGTTGFGDDIGASFSKQNQYSLLGLTLKVPIFNGFKRNAQYSQAKYKLQNAQENMALDADRYRMEYENARTKLVKAMVNIENDRRNIALANSVFNSTNLQYQKGVTDLTDWLNAQQSLKEAQNNYLSSLYAVYSATLELEKANGTLINYYHSL